VRNQSVKITQIKLKNVSKADRIKKLHYENKYLYGAKIKKNEKEDVIVMNAGEETANPKEISSEIYWTCLHVPEVQDFTKPSKKTKEKKSKKDSDKPVKPKKVADEATIKPEVIGSGKPLKISKKYLVQVKTSNKEQKLTAVETASDISCEDGEKLSDTKWKRKPAERIVKVPELPKTLTKLRSVILPEVKAKMKQTLSNNFKLKDLESSGDSGSSDDERDIPFETQQLRAIPNFPLILNSNKLVVDTFEKFIPGESAGYTMPSVSKVLQATMPQSQRLALIQWKNLKISEMGLEGFEIMQKCKHFNFGSCTRF
jgi:hypothetical protein